QHTSGGGWTRCRLRPTRGQGQYSEATVNTNCTNEGLERGPFLYRDAQDSTISVMECPGAGSTVGKAVPTSWAPDGAALWKLIIRGSVLPGCFMIRDRRFTRSC